ncbi:hypothetical protein MNBD_GAMMA11-2198 [hydrothermal vent metagenome]|uniref:Uncharacterized protein n=1 Tax=hydrothermal vent metagenome TaxID=652676 RepID=A0A3B0XJH4_9ZZZZ
MTVMKIPGDISAEAVCKLRVKLYKKRSINIFLYSFKKFNDKNLIQSEDRINLKGASEKTGKMY